MHEHDVPRWMADRVGPLRRQRRGEDLDIARIEG